MSASGKQYYEYYKSIGRCPNCQQRVTDGKVYCPECRMKRNAQRRAWYRRISGDRKQEYLEQMREWRVRQKEAKYESNLGT